MKKIRFLYFTLVFIWFFVCIYVLFSFLNNDFAWTDSEISVAYYYKMIALTFPSGILFTTIGNVILDIFSDVGFDVFSNMNPKIELLSIWLFMVFVGFLQWFVLIPKIYKWVTNKF